ncbi:MAG: hypothetical protein HY516_00205 [Candidatus Aenigmarchaeota archaeon]|nr:hypothetical protein [Candidatus Aenigmarchaeota archaeon]
MKRGMLATMERLDIDKGIGELVRQLWKHCYKTTDSCAGRGSEAYVMFTGGDGWFEKNASKYGLSGVENKDCCPGEFQEEIRKHGLDPADYVDRRKACGCGAGVNGYFVYRGTLVQNPFKPEF